MEPLYWLLAFLVFGVLIFLHELGHFLCARLFGVGVIEFSIGMGPRLLSYTSKKSGTKYSLSMLPIGGYVSMVGEDDASDAENSFGKKAAWKRFIVTAAGAAMNLLTGFVIMLLVVSMSGVLGSNRIAAFLDDSVYEEQGITSTETYGLAVGDEIIAINGTPVHIAFDLSYEIMHQGGEGPVDVTFRRDGVVRTVSVTFPAFTEQGVTFGQADFYVARDDFHPFNVLRHTWHRATGTVKMVWESLGDLLTGRYGMESVSGPIGAAGAMTEAAKSGGIEQLLLLAAVISINLGIVNLLPIPALDGGRLVFLLFEMIFRRPVPQKYEAMVHFIGMMLLLGLMVLLIFKDLFTIFT